MRKFLIEVDDQTADQIEAWLAGMRTVRTTKIEPGQELGVLVKEGIASKLRDILEEMKAVFRKAPPDSEQLAVQQRIARIIDQQKFLPKQDRSMQARQTRKL